MQPSKKIELSKVSAIPLIKRVGKNAGALSTTIVVQLLSQFAIIPIAFKFWGESRYGEWLSLAGLVVFLKLADFGLQSFVLNEICSHFALNNKQKVQHLLHSALKIQWSLFAGILFLVASFQYIYPVDSILNLQSIHGSALYWVLLLLAIEVLLGLPLGTMVGLYRSSERMHRAALIGTTHQLLVLIVSVTLISKNASFLSLALTRVLLATAQSIWISVDLSRMYPWLKLWPTEGSWKRGFNMVKPGLFFLLIPLSDYLCTQVTLTLVQRNLGGAQVSQLATHRTVANLAMFFCQTLMSSVWPELTLLKARGQGLQLLRVHRSLTKLNLWVISICIISLLPILLFLYPLWTTKKLSVDAWTLGLLQAEVLIWGFWGASMTLLLSTNHHKKVTLALLASAILTCSLAKLMVPWIGIRGVALANLLGDLSLIAWIAPVLAARGSADTGASFYRELIPFLIKSVLLPIAVGLLLNFYLTGSQVLKFSVAIPISIWVSVACTWRELVPVEKELLKRLYSKVCALKK